MKTAALTAIALLLAACGQTGPLKLPEPKAEAAQPKEAEAKPATPPQAP